MQKLLWEFLPTNAPEFRPISAFGGCSLVGIESVSQIDEIDLDATLGEGRFGEVRLGFLRGGAPVAVKRIAKVAVKTLGALRNLVASPMLI